MSVASGESEAAAPGPTRLRSIATGEWVISRTNHYWLTIFWLTVGLVLWVILRNVLWFVGFVSLYAIWITHLAGWAAETPVEEESDGEDG